MNDELNSVARPHRLATAVFHGGAAYGPQEGALRNGIDILVATPGRIMDHLQVCPAAAAVAAGRQQRRWHPCELRC